VHVVCILFLRFRQYHLFSTLFYTIWYGCIYLERGRPLKSQRNRTLPSTELRIKDGQYHSNISPFADNNNHIIMTGLFPPLTVMLSWPPANYTDPTRRSKAVLITACILAPLTLLIVGARTWARAVIQRNFGIDDWIMVFAMIPTMGLAIIVCLATERFNFDRHIWDVLPTMYVDLRKITFACYLLYIVAGGMIKISILLFYRRLDSRSITKSFRVATWINIVAIAIFCTAFVVTLFLSCDPWTAFWDQYDLTRSIKFHCRVDEGADLISASIISAVQDAIAAFLPTILYWNLRIPQRQKGALGAIFALGYIVCIVAAVRTYYVWRIFNSLSYDSTWEAWPAWLLCLLEVHLGAICASSPALKVFLAHYFKVAASKIGPSDTGSMTIVVWIKVSMSRSTASKQSGSGYFREAHTRDGSGGIVLESQKAKTDWVADERNWNVV
jgi:hypothetical protein